MDLEALSLTSISGVIAATLVIVEILKRFISQYKAFNQVPVWLYSVIVAAALGLLANKVLTVPDGSTVLLPGHALSILWKCILGAASASGIYSWVHNPETLKTAAQDSKESKDVATDLGPDPRNYPDGL